MTNTCRDDIRWDEFYPQFLWKWSYFSWWDTRLMFQTKGTIWDCLKNTKPLGVRKYRKSQHYCLVCICVYVLRFVLWISRPILFSMLSWCLFFNEKCPFLIVKKRFFYSLWEGGKTGSRVHWPEDFYSSRILAVAENKPSGTAEDSQIDQWNSWTTTTPAH